MLYLLSLILTLGIELFIAFILNIRDKKNLSIIIAINIITHPLLGLFVRLNHTFKFINFNLINIILIELLIILIEFLLLKIYLQKNFKESIILSISINAVSFLSGLLIFDYQF